ncbi:FAD-binding oxidoreductase [Candidatus Desantisbacteria bacterium]|nr:FAD-binding oxidoreductase [Candidatus Desantisbacteria bacterium]
MHKFLTREQEETLKKIFDSRITFEMIDRMLYSHDMASIPSIIEKMIIKIPLAVVQPLNEEEIVSLIKFSHKHLIPLTPRGSGTSGYGGAIPVQGGIVVDFTRMNKVISIDENAETVTVEPGVIWKDLENIIELKGLDLRTFPSISLASTVGGWTAEGGAGFGGYEYGFFYKSIKSVTFVNTQGEIKHVSEDELDLVYELEGITGFITQVTLKLKENNRINIVIAAFPTLDTIIKAISDINEKNIPLWNLIYELPLFAKFKQEIHDLKFYPRDKYILICMYPDKRENVVKNPLIEIIKINKGEIMGAEASSWYWDSRYYPMRFKSLGPSIISGEVVLSFNHLEELIKKIEKNIPDMSLHGSIIEKDKANLIGFALDDERNTEYTNHSKKSLEMIELAESLGGRVYTLGMYFHDRALSVLGEKKFNMVKEFKKVSDPNDIFNPGKVILMKGEHDASTHLKTALKASSLMGDSLSSLAGTLLSDRIRRPAGFPEKIFNEAFACAQCGFCRKDCPIYKATFKEKFSPRGKWYLIRQLLKNNLKYSQEIADLFSFCATCGKCDIHCQTEIPVFECWNIMKTYQKEDKKLDSFPVFELMTWIEEITGNIWGIPKDTRVNILPIGSEASDNLFWSGCTLSLRTDEAQNINTILSKSGFKFMNFGQEEECCGILMLFWGYKEKAYEIFKENINNFKKNNIKTIITYCPGCYLGFKKYYPIFAEESGMKWDIKVLHISELIQDLIINDQLEFRQMPSYTLKYHDPCYLGTHAKLYHPPRKVLQSLPGIKFKEMAASHEDALCCGHFITRVNESNISDKIAGDICKKIGKDEILVTACDFCQMQFEALKNPDVKIRSLISLVREAIEPSNIPESLALEPVKYINFFKQIMDFFNYGFILKIIKENIKLIITPLPTSILDAVNHVKKASIFTYVPAIAKFEKTIRDSIPFLIERASEEIGNICSVKLLPLVEENTPEPLKDSLSQILAYISYKIIQKNEAIIINDISAEVIKEIKKEYL